MIEHGILNHKFNTFQILIVSTSYVLFHESRSQLNMIELGNLNHTSDALSRYKLFYKSDFTMKPTVLRPNAPMQYRPLGMSIEFTVFGMRQCFALMRFMFARTNHTLSSAPEVSSHILLHFPAFSNQSCWAAECAQRHRAAPSSKTSMWLKNQRLYGCWAQVASITDAHNYRGKEQGWAERAKHKHCLDHRGRAGKSNVTIPPNRRRVILGSR